MMRPSRAGDLRQKELNAKSYQRAKSLGICVKCRMPNHGSTRAVCKSCEEVRRRDYATRDGRGRLMLANIKVRSRRDGLAFDLTMDWFVKTWERQGGRCAISGIPFDLAKWTGPGFRSPYSLSFDRIRAGGGYTQDNVRLVNTFWNIAMGPWGEQVAFDIFETSRRNR